MIKPEVSLSNSSDVYNFYLLYRPNRISNRLGHAAMGLLYKPNVHYQDQAEQDITERLDDGVSLIIAANHTNDLDQFQIAAMAQHQPTLRRLRGETFILAKSILFNKGRLLRYGAESMGSVPAFRRKDIAGLKDEAEQQEHLVRATDEMIDMAAERVAAGEHMAIFPEGTRNKEAPKIVQKNRRGMGEIACRASERTSVSIVPVGIYYGSEPNYSARRPQLVIGTPIDGGFTSTEAVSSQTGEAMQACVEEAVALKQVRDL